MMPVAQTKASVAFKSFLRSLPFTIGGAVTVQYGANPTSTWQDYGRAILAALVASILKGFTSLWTAQEVTLKA